MRQRTNILRLSRRHFLGTGAALFATGIAPRAFAGIPAVRFLSARGGDGDSWFATGFDANGAIAFDLAIEARGHGAARDRATGETLLFARRPGDFALVIDTQAGTIRQRIDASPGRYFNGHGIFSADGTRLFTTETASDTGDGLIGIYDATAHYSRIGEFASGGLDPHDMRRLPDGRLVVANGGLLTDPAEPGIKLNVATMTSSLAILDPRDGTIEHSFRVAPSLFQLSLRHLALDAEGGVAVAMQYEGPAVDHVPLVAYLAPGARDLVALDPPAPVLRQLDQYCGSAAVDASGRLLAVTSPRGGIAAFWDLPAQRFLGTTTLADGCGIAAAGISGEAADDGAGAFLFSSGLGGLLRCEPAADQATILIESDPLAPTIRWDNHILALG